MRAKAGIEVQVKLKTVEMLCPQTGEEFVAVVEDGKATPCTKIENRDMVRIERERDELLAALKATVADFEFVDKEAHDAFHREIGGDDPGYGGRQTINAARALIARIEGQNGK